MIASLRGRIQAREMDHVVLEVGGLGYQVHCSERTLVALRGADEAMLYTHYAIRQEIPTLYGFMSERERAAFRLLLTVQRVGPKVALGILGTIDLEQLGAAIADEDTRALAVVSGVSVKLAQKIVVELRDQFPHTGVAPRSGNLAIDAEVVDALVSLGYGVVEAQRAVQAIPMEAPDDVGERLRIALGRMGPAE